MNDDFRVEVCEEFLARVRSDAQASVGATDYSGAFESYNRGGGPGGDYDRHYDKSTGSR